MYIENSKLKCDLIENIVWDGIDHSDYPDYCDAYITEATYNGVPMDPDGIDLINEDRDFVYRKLMDHLY